MSPFRLRWIAGTTALLAAIALHCGGDAESAFGDPNATPCETDFAGQCGKPCTTDTECAPNLYCGGGACTADCSPSRACGGGLSCNARNRCANPNEQGFGDTDSGDPTPPDAGICADTNVTLTKVLPRVLFLLDQSSSMWKFKFPSGSSEVGGVECASGCRWTDLKDVLIGKNVGEGLVKSLEAEAELGIEMYSATDTNTGDGDNSYLLPASNPVAVCPRFNGKRFDGVQLSLNAYNTINSALRPATVDDDTPTGPAVRGVVGLAADGGVIADGGGLATLPGEAPKVLVLVTDGEPGRCGDNNTSDEGKAQVVSAVADTFRQNIKTFVIAIGDVNGTAKAHFDAVARAGQGQAANGDAGAILPSSPAALVEALRQIVLGARNCTFDLNGTVQAGRERDGTVTLNGQRVPFAESGAADGWRLVNASRIELIGATCNTLKTTPDAQLSAAFPCGAVVPVTR